MSRTDSGLQLRSLVKAEWGIDGWLLFPFLEQFALSLIALYHHPNDIQQCQR
jgi:hypothetical protein